MKSFAITVLVSGALFLAYDFFLAPDHDKIVFAKLRVVDRPSESSAAPSKSQAQSSGQTWEQVEPPARTAEPVDEVPSPKASEMNEVAPSTPSEVVPNGVPSVEEYTGNWTKFPSSAFPRPVRLLQAARFHTQAGSVWVQSGGDVIALGSHSGRLEVTPSNGSPLRATVPIDSTDFKPRMTALYDAWKARQVAAKPSVAVPSESIAPPKSTLVEEDGSPKVALDGTIPMLVNAMRDGKFSDVTPQNITHWGRPRLEMVNGKPVWAVAINYMSDTQTGPMEAETVVHIAEGRILSWRFNGSGEEVP